MSALIEKKKRYIDYQIDELTQVGEREKDKERSKTVWIEWMDRWRESLI